MYLLKFWITSILLYPIFLLLFLCISPLFTAPSDLMMHYIIQVFNIAYLSIPAFLISFVINKLLSIRRFSRSVVKAMYAAVCITAMIATFSLLPDDSLLNPGDYIVQSSAAIAVALIISTLIFEMNLERKIL